MITLLLTYTPRAGVELTEYYAWLREVDNPFFNARPVVRRYVNYRVQHSLLGEAGFTHFDLLEIEGDAEGSAVMYDPSIAAFARDWVRKWRANADPDVPDQAVNYHVHQCETIASPETTL